MATSSMVAITISSIILLMMGRVRKEISGLVTIFSNDLLGM